MGHFPPFRLSATNSTPLRPTILRKPHLATSILPTSLPIIFCCMHRGLRSTHSVQILDPHTLHDPSHLVVLKRFVITLANRSPTIMHGRVTYKNPKLKTNSLHIRHVHPRGVQIFTFLLNSSSVLICFI